MQVGRFVGRLADVDVEPFVQRFPVVWHCSPLGSWESIETFGLRTTEQLVHASSLSQEEGDQLLKTIRATEVRLMVEIGGVTLRDQGRLLVRKDLSPILGPGLTVQDWLALLNRRVYFFGQRSEMQPLLSKYTAESGQDVLRLNTRKLIEQVGSRLEVAEQNTGAIARTSQPQKFKDTFRPIARLANATHVKEITVVD